MRVLLQWAQRNPRDWVEIDSSEWSTLSDRGVPPPGRTDNPGNQLGWINRLCVQGVHFAGDHYAIRNLPGGACELTLWDDDPQDWSAGDFLARVWTFNPIAPDPRIGGGWNTSQSQVIYAATDIRARLQQIGPFENTVILPWEEFVPPATIARHGVWLSDTLYAAHNAQLRRISWREWTPL